MYTFKALQTAVPTGTTTMVCNESK